MRLSKSVVDRITPPPLKNGKAVQRFCRDSALPGFALRVTSNGTKAFVVEKKLNGRARRYTVGRYGPLTVEQARKQAQKLLGEMVMGRDPVQEKALKRLQTITMRRVFEDYIADRKDLRPATVANYGRHFSEGLKDWQDKRLVDITKDMIGKRHHLLGQRSHARANGVMRFLRALFNHAIAKYEDDKGNPRSLPSTRCSGSIIPVPGIRTNANNPLLNPIK